MPDSFYAKITPIPDPNQPPYPSQGPGFPTHPIVIPPNQPNPPSGGSPQYPSHPIYNPPYPDNSLPPFPNHPIVIPPLPPDLKPEPPIYYPPEPTHPIFIPITPEEPIELPPGQVWPPLPPDTGISGQALILIYVVGVGYRWMVYDGPETCPPGEASTKPGPKSSE